MIKSIKHKGLKHFFETGSTSGIRADHAVRLRDRLTVLDVATAWMISPSATGHYIPSLVA